MEAVQLARPRIRPTVNSTAGIALLVRLFREREFSEPDGPRVKRSILAISAGPAGRLSWATLRPAAQIADSVSPKRRPDPAIRRGMRQ